MSSPAPVAETAGAGASRVGPYRLLERVGRGGVADVFLAERLEGTRVRVALKRVRADAADRAAAMRALLDEAQSAAPLAHPHIVRVLDVGLDAGEVYLVREYVAGVTLAQLRKRARILGRPVPLAVVATLARALFDALAYAHERAPAVVHGDVSPTNVLVSFDGNVLLGDFGVGNPSSALHEAAPRGQRAYRAPEQHDGGPASAAADVYAAALVIGELLEGQPRTSFPGHAPATEGAATSPYDDLTVQTLALRGVLAAGQQRAPQLRPSARAIERALVDLVPTTIPATSPRELGASVRASFAAELAREEARRAWQGQPEGAADATTVRDDEPLTELVIPLVRAGGRQAALTPTEPARTAHRAASAGSPIGYAERWARPLVARPLDMEATRARSSRRARSAFGLVLVLTLLGAALAATFIQ